MGNLRKFFVECQQKVLAEMARGREVTAYYGRDPYASWADQRPGTEGPGYMLVAALRRRGLIAPVRQNRSGTHETLAITDAGRAALEDHD